MGTRDRMREGETERPIREAWPLRGVIAWTLGLVVVANIAFAAIRLAG